MNLGIDIRSLTTACPTGISHYVYEMLTEFAQMKDVSQVTFNLFSSGHSFQQNPHSIMSNFHHIHDPRPNRLLNIMWGLQLEPSWDNYLHGIDYFWLPAVNIYCPHEKIPFALTVHDVSFITRPYYYTLTGRIWHLLANFKNLIKHAYKIITVSESTYRELMNLFPILQKKDIKIIYPGIRPYDVSDSDREEVQTKYKLKHRFILYVGTVEPRKNVHTLIRAFNDVAKKDPDLMLVITGKIQSSVYARILQSSRNVIVTNYATEKEKHVLYDMASVFVWPSMYEGFGFPPLEALLHGTPTIVSYRTALPEILRANVLYVNPYNYSELVSVLHEALSGRIKVHPSCKQQITSLYSWKRCAQEFFSFICD